VADGDRLVMAHAAPTPCMAEPMFDTNAAIHRERNTGLCSGAHALGALADIAGGPMGGG
jgi:hypothetical protein